MELKEFQEMFIRDHIVPLLDTEIQIEIARHTYVAETDGQTTYVLVVDTIEGIDKEMIKNAATSYDGLVITKSPDTLVISSCKEDFALFLVDVIV